MDEDVLGAADLQAVLCGDFQSLNGHVGDFGGFDNEAIDFRHLEDYINGDDENNIYFPESLVGNEVKNPEPSLAKSNGTNLINLPPTSTTATGTTNITTTSSSASSTATPISSQQLIYGLVGPPGLGFKNGTITNGYGHPGHNLPDSPPDSGSEPPYSPPNEGILGGDRAVARGPINLPELVLPSMSRGHQQQQQELLSFANTQPLKHLPDGRIISPPGSQQQQVAALHQTALGQPLTVDVLSCPNPIVSPLTPVFGGLPVSQLYPGSKKRKLCESPGGGSGSAPAVGADVLNGLVQIKQEPAVLPPPMAPIRQCVSPDQVSNQSSAQHRQQHQQQQQQSGDNVHLVDDDLAFDFSDDSGTPFPGGDSTFQCIRFQQFQPASWHVICDQTLKELSTPNYRVDADKGFNFSNADDAFVCQKKNHFQVTVHAQLTGDPQYVRTLEGLKTIDSFHIHFYGVKVESLNQSIKVEQSQSDRSKKPFHPVQVEMSREQMVKLTVGRLHFSETTSNNMRKKGKPNPDQRYFYLVVGLHAHCGDANYPIASQCSERIIVRASNPGQFESEVELSWQKGTTPESIFHAGRVGINTDRPDETLVVHGNVRVTGHIVQPSDARAKEDIQELDTKEQLRNLQQLRIVRYQYNEDFAQHAGLTQDERRDTGVIAQEVQRVIPDAVKAAGDIVLPSGERIDNFLVVNKDRIFIENIGAVKELCKVTDNLENRIDELERMNNKLAKLKRIDSLMSTSSGSTITSLPGGHSSTKKPLRRRRRHRLDHKPFGLCSNKFVQGTIVVLILVMALCLIAMATLYILEWQKRQVYEYSAASASNQEISKVVFNHSQIAGLDNSTFGLPRPPGNDSTTLSSVAKTPSVIQATSSSFTVRVHGRKDPIGVPAHCVGPKALANNCSSFCCNEQETHSATKRPPSAQGNTQAVLTTSTARAIVAGNSSGANTSEAEAASGRNIPRVSLGIGKNGANGTRNSAVSTVTSYPQRASMRPPYEHVEQATDGSIAMDISENKLSVSDSENNEARQDMQYPTVIRLNKPYPFLKMKNEKPFRHNRETSGAAEGAGRRKRQSAKGGRSLANSSGINFAHLVRSVRLLEFNHTISPEYCLHCREGNYTYVIPVSSYMTQQTLTMEFRLSATSGIYIDYCQTGNKITGCSSMYSRDSLDAILDSEITIDRKTEEVTPSWILPIGKFVESSYKFRVTSIPNHTDACMADPDLANITFVEYNFVFYRSCSD